MKKRALLLAVFMLALFAIPAFHGTTPLTERSNKAYYGAEDWEEIGNATIGFQTPDWKIAGNASVGFKTPSEPSPQSLSSFTETIPDDVLYYPDMYVQEATYGNVSGTETNDYTYMLDDDASYWHNAHGGSDGYSYIDVEGPILAESVNVTINALASGPIATHTVYLYLVNPSGADLLISQDTGTGAGDAEIDGTYTISDWMSYEDNGNHTFYLKSLQGGANPVSLLGDYFHIGPIAGYAESFSDNSDWASMAANPLEGLDTASTDGDVLSLEIVAAAGNDRDWYIQDLPVPLTDLSNLYLEFVHKENKTVGLDYAKIWLFDTSLCSGSDYFQYDLTLNTTWVSQKVYVPSLSEVGTVDNITSIAIGIKHDSGSIKLEFDSIRIGDSNKMGWQHDASTLAGTDIDNDVDFTYYDEILNSDTRNMSAITSAATPQWADFEFYFDTTTTETEIETDYYEFFEVRWRCTSYVAGTNSLYFYINTDSRKLSPATGYKTGVFDWTTERVNFDACIVAGTKNIISFVVNTDSVGEGAVFEVDYTKFYSIANYTVTQSSTTTNDYLYTEDGVLHSVVDSGEIVIDRDPALSITTPYHSWEINTTQGTPQTSIYTGAWSSYTTNTTGAFPHDETLSDLRLKFTDNATINGVIFGFALEWVMMPAAYLMFRGAMWNDIVSALVWFMNSFDQNLIQWYLSIIGCVVIPLSTVVLAKGSRDGMSRDKLFLFLIVFFIGWGLLLGGLA